MANILEKYGIKEVADVWFYEIDEKGKPGAPVLYLDTLKVSTIEQTGEEAEAKGGKGNTALVSWDFGKEITLTLEDALFSIKSMEVMFGGKMDNTVKTLLKTIDVTWNKALTGSETFDLKDRKVKIPQTGKYYKKETGEEVQSGEVTTALGKIDKEPLVYTFEMPIDGVVINISADQFPGTYYITGDTFARSAVSGKDEFFQFIVPKGKVKSEQTITMEAEGDPSTFNMTVKVLRPDDRKMIKLVKYDVTSA